MTSILSRSSNCRPVIMEMNLWVSHWVLIYAHILTSCRSILPTRDPSLTLKAAHGYHLHPNTSLVSLTTTSLHSLQAHSLPSTHNHHQHLQFPQELQQPLLLLLPHNHGLIREALSMSKSSLFPLNPPRANLSYRPSLSHDSYAFKLFDRYTGRVNYHWKG
jgi:hypothetical protein